eukprot:2433622-Pleurochrysis_carterae.AAC.1
MNFWRVRSLHASPHCMHRLPACTDSLHALSLVSAMLRERCLLSRTGRSAFGMARADRGPHARSTLAAAPRRRRR